MKNGMKTFMYMLLLMGVICTLTSSCKKDDNNSTSTTVTDIDGNVYNTVKIGTQTWMAENLKVTKYSNGDPIPNVSVNSTWAALTSGAYCWYNNDAATNKAIYGALYNWYAATDSRNIAPLGWHVPTDAEWITLTTYLGESVAGGKLKETGTSHWVSPNTGATNSTSFTALPGGVRDYDGACKDTGSYGYWWSSTESLPDAWLRSMYSNNSNVKREVSLKVYGFSVRCIKD